jgi:hypothetical protein
MILCGYLLIAAVLIIIKITQLALGLGDHPGAESGPDAMASACHPDVGHDLRLTSTIVA